MNEPEFARYKANHYLKSAMLEYTDGVPDAVAQQYKMYFWRLGQLDVFRRQGSCLDV